MIIATVLSVILSPLFPPLAGNERPCGVFATHLGTELVTPLPAIQSASGGQTSTQKPAPKPHPEVQKLIDEATDDKLDWKDMPPLLEKALKRARELMDRYGEGQVSTWLGLTMIEIGQPRRAFDYLIHAGRLFEDMNDLIGAAPAYSNLGLANLKLGEYAQALTHLKRASEIFRRAEMKSELATVLSNIGDCQLMQANRKEAMSAYMESLAIRQGLGDVSGQSTVLSNIGQAYLGAGDLRVSLEYYSRSLKLAVLAKKPESEAPIIHNIACVWLALGDYSAAIENFDNALEKFKLLSNSHGVAATLNNLGLAWQSQGNPKKALEYYRRALPIDIGNHDVRGQAAVLHNIGSALGDLGDKIECIKYLERALPLRESSGDLQGVATTLDSLGVAVQRVGKRTQARDYFQRALLVRRRVEDPQGEANTLTNLGSVWQVLGEPEICCVLWKQSVNRRQEQRQRAAGVSSRADLMMLKKLASTYAALANSLESQGRIAESMQVQELQEASKVKEFVYRGTLEQDILQKRLTLTKLEKHWLAKYEEVAKPLGQLENEREQLARIKDRLPDEEKKLKKVDANLHIAEANFKKVIRDMTTAFKSATLEDNKLEDLAKDRDLTQVAKTVTERAVKKVGCLATMVSEKSFHLMLILPDGKVVTKEIKVSRSDLSKAVISALADLNNPNRQPYESTNKLYNWVIAPFQHDLTEQKLDCLMFNLNGPLRYVPMAALWDGEYYLAEKYQVTNFSIAVWENLASEPAKRPWKSAFFGSTGGQDGFAPLPGVKVETESAAPLFGASPQLDQAFTKATLESLLKAKATNLLHFGTHFVLDPSSSEETYMLLGDGKKWRPTEMEDNKDLSFDGVELLVASACKTGVPTGDDASIEGFGAYCQVKGARAVLSSLWEVNDESTSLWMKSFYGQLAGGASKGEAFHRAQLALITGETASQVKLPKGGSRSGATSKPPKMAPGKPFVVDPKRPLAHPYYWAPFTLGGNWR